MTVEQTAPIDELVIGIDVGGTSVKARVVDAHGAVRGERRVPTPLNDSSGQRVAFEVVRLLIWAREVAEECRSVLSCVGLVVPGVVDEQTGTVILAVNLGWRDVPLRMLVERQMAEDGVALPLVLAQDMRAGALAEAHTRPEAGVTVFAAIGTGLSCAVVIDGKLPLGSAWSGEIGQYRFTSGRHAGLRLEEVGSARAVAQGLGLPGSKEVADLVAAGNLNAVDIWHDCVDAVADSLAWATLVTGCRSIIIGGGLAEAGDLLLEPLTEGLEKRLAGVRMPSVTRATHGDNAGAVGATILASMHTTRDVVVHDAPI